MIVCVLFSVVFVKFQLVIS